MNTMAVKFVLVFSTVLFTGKFSAGGDGIFTGPDEYKKYWLEVSRLEEDNLPKSAAERVDEIYNLAFSEKNEQQILKSTIYRLKYINILEDEGYVKAIEKLESEMQIYDGTAKAIMHLFLATMYYDYYNANKYLIDQRSITLGFENPDIRTWDKTKFQDKIIKNYLLSLDDRLKSIDIADYSDIIENATLSKDRYPTLYDFVAYYSTNKLSNNNYYYRYDNSDKLSENAYLSTADIFVNLPVNADTLSFSYATVKIYQLWLKNRLENSINNEALVNTDLDRLNFVKNNLSTANKDKIWESTMLKLHDKFVDTPELTMINYQLAGYYNTLGSSYDFRDSTKNQYRSYKKKSISLLNEALERYPKSVYSVECTNLKNNIEAPDLAFEVAEVASVDRKFPVRISYKNADTIYMTILKTNYQEFLEMRKSVNDEKYLEEVLKISEFVENSKLVKLPESDDYNIHYTEYLVDAMNYGFYTIFLHAKPEFSLKNNLIASSELFVSNMSMTSNTYNFTNGCYVNNRNTGKPIENAKIDVFRYNYNYQKRENEYVKLGTAYTDKNGFASLNSYKSKDYRLIRLDVSSDKDFISKSSALYSEHEVGNETVREVKFFTDRAIYRPGQTIYFKGVCLKRNAGNVEIMPNTSVKVSLQDVNTQEISTLTLRSNEFGSINGSFEIPLGVLTGSFVLNTENGSHYIQVEEYKRPMFEINMLPVEGEYKINDSVYADGIAKTYAGTGLTDAKVTYSVVRQPVWRPYYRYWNIEAKEVAFGETTVDDNGKFRIGFKAIVDEIETLNSIVSYNYSINVSVTDINGETQNSSSFVFVSNKALEIMENMENVVLREHVDSITIDTRNISGNFVPADVEIEIFKLKDPGMLLTERQWENIDMPLYSKAEWYKQYPGNEYGDETDFSVWESSRSVYRSKINTKNTQKLKLDGIEKWSSGIYRIVLSSMDKWGNDIKYTKEFTLFSEKDKKLPYVTTDLFYTDKTSAQPGETVNVYLGSSYKDVYAFYELETEGKVRKQEIIRINSEIKKIEIPVEESYRGGIVVNIMFIREGRMYTYSQNINVDWKNKGLDIKFITFRDKTLPGAKENWQLKITDYLSKPAQAEFMACMYDASLDIFAQNYWDLSLNPYYSTNIFWQNYTFAYNRSVKKYKDFFQPALTRQIYTPQLLFFNFYNYGGNMRYKMMASPSSNGEAAEELQMMDFAKFEDEGGLSDNSVSSSKELSGSIDQMERATGGQQETQIRQNFNETAFFYPNLITNAEGEILLSFTMPESLTRWNFMGLAHTKDLKVGQITKNIITQKELMVMPNLPRFFRENDKISVSTKINNVSEVVISGNARIEFFDPETLTSLNDKFIGSTTNVIAFNVDKNNNVSVSWNVSIPEGISAVGVRIVAEGKNHSDGEERILPVLTNSIFVTESLPLPVRKAGTTKFTMNRLKDSRASSTLRNHNYTLEFTANPAWYAVQALPYLMEYPYECAEQTFSRFYANSLATHVANSDPKIKRVFDLWKNAAGSNTLMSNLEKNQELKSLLVEETPWLLDAKDENERKHRIGLLFDINRMNMENNSAIKKLSEMQQYNGGWPWFKGMPESWYISQHIIGGFGHLNKLGVDGIKNDSNIWSMVTKAISFIDYELEEGYKNLKKNCDEKCLSEKNIGYIQIHYLYVRSFFVQDIPVKESTKEAFDYYKGQAAKYWKDENFYMQGMLALALHRYADETTPLKIIASIKEHALSSEEMGMYWKVPSGYYWYQAPIETQALLIEAFEEVSGDKTSVEEMKVWLLKQKQTQDWKTTKATSEAIYALLLNGTNLLAETDFPIINIGNMTVDVESDPEIKAEAGTGYFKKTWDGGQITPEWGNVSVTKKSNSVAWGAVYWQYFEQLDKVTKFEETPLIINKKLFVENRAGDRSVILPVERNTKLTVGDKVKVRIEIRVDRDMEYVHLKDMRASCFEPVDYISGYRYKSGLGYYQGIKDASMNFFIDYLRKGTYVFEYDLIVSQRGDFSNGITTMQCMYAPEFTTHSEGVRVVVD